jgi:hypothetical protein
MGGDVEKLNFNKHARLRKLIQYKL